MMKKWLIFSIVCFCSFWFSPVLAQNYYYDSINVNINVNEDSTFDIAENQTYYLNGSFGFLSRDIELKRLDDISNIEVLDSSGNAISKSDLDIKYIGNKLHIQWNFIRRDFNQELKSWIVKYKVHGGLGFYKNYDEIYWNAIFADRTVEVKNAKIIVYLPEGINKTDIKPKILLGAMGSTKQSYDFEVKNNSIVELLGRNIESGEFMTIVISWPKGFVKKPFLYKNQIIALSATVLAIIIILIAFIILFSVWKKRGKDAKINKTIIAQYDAGSLSPAEVGVLIKQNVTVKEILGTLISLAVRGYLRIREEEKGFSIFKSKEYVFEKLNDNGSLKPFEEKIFNAVFKEKTSVTTSDLKNKFYKEIPGIQKEIYKEVAKTPFFNGNIQEIRKKYTRFYLLSLFFLIIPLFLITILSSKLNLYPTTLISLFIVFLGLIVSIIMGLIFAHFMPALTIEGAEAKWKALGFREYLNTAERFRVGSETVETFSKLLPFAIIFGVEKQWAERFAYFSYQEQGWYMPIMTHGGPPNSFGDFTSSFSTFSNSLSNTFSSSPGGSGSGSGGSAGGGGGGGSGGAG
jgi:uncharacterized membrane protein YgcG